MDKIDDYQTGDPNCKICGGHGTLVTYEESKAGIYPEGTFVDVGNPCKCVINRRVLHWLDPLLKMLPDRECLLKYSPDNSILSQITTDKNLILEGNKEGCIFYFEKALKNYLSKNKLERGFLEYTVISDYQIWELYWRESEDLKDFPWERYKLLIITLGDLPGNAPDINQSAVVGRISDYINGGGKVWAAYHYKGRAWDTSDSKHPIAGPRFSGLENRFHFIKLTQNLFRREDSFMGVVLPPINGAEGFQKDFPTA